MKFFFDNNISPRTARALHALVEPRHQCIHLREKFRSDIRDEEWIHSLAEEGGWIVISGDYKILKRKAEKLALDQAGLTVFFLKRGWTKSTSLKLEQLTGKLLLRWSEIARLAESALPGQAFDVPLKGKIKKI